MFIIKLFILLFIFHFHYSSLVGCFFQLATCGPAGFCTLCWWNWIQTLFQKFWTLFQRFCWWNWIETLSQKFWTLSQRLGALFQRLLFCFCALFQRLFVVQPFSKGMAWLRSFPKPFGGCLFQSFYLLNFKVSLHCLSKVTENHALRHITMPAPLCADGKSHQATLQALLGHLWWIIKNHRGPKLLADFLFSPWTCPFPSAVNFQLLEQVLGKEVPGIFLDLPFPFFTFHIAHYVDLFGGLDQPP